MTLELPPLNVYKRWLCSGFGRAALVTHPEMPQEYKDEIVAYALKDYRIDRQFGAPLGSFLCELAMRSEMEDQIIDRLIESGFEDEAIRDVDHRHRGHERSTRRWTTTQCDRCREAHGGAPTERRGDQGIALGLRDLDMR